MNALRLAPLCFVATLFLALGAPARLSADCLSADCLSAEAAASPAASPGAGASETALHAALPAAASEAAPAALPAVVGMPEAVYVSSQGQRLAARFDIPGKTVRLTLPDGRTLSLPLAVSGSGARYSNGAQTFWEHQGCAIFEERGVLLFEGRETPAR